ncbi:MAG: helix-turn-helix domain-containing protein [Deltaproteobacteria bacterium]|nr:helix-turn-helix domain-containing protein [Deltaproteobacteria bacterium]
MVKIKQEQLLSATEAAEYLNVSRNAVHELIKRAMLPAIKVGKHYIIKEEALVMYKNSDAWKRGQQQKERIKG